MQIKCGQCGTLHELETIEGMESVRCVHCGHSIGSLNMAVEPGYTVCEGRFDDDTEGFAQQARQALRERMLVVCAHCNARIRVSKRMAGQVIRCTSCSKELSVPDAAAEDQVDISYLISPSDIVMGQDPNAQKSWRTQTFHQRLIRRKRVQLGLKVLGGIILIVLVVSIIRQGIDSSESQMEYVGEESHERGYHSPDDNVAEKTEPASSTSETTAMAPVAPDAPTEPSLRLVGEPAWSAFASGGYYPARLGHLYCVLTVQLTSADDKPMRIDPTVSARLVLDNFDEKTLPCLGETVENTLLPVQAHRRNIELTAGDPATVHLLFEVPQTARRGTLQIHALGKLPVTLLVPDSPKTAPVGRFVEVAPRNLKVLLNDPVMAAIQSAPRQELRIRKNGSLLDVRIDEAEVIGQARSAGTGAYTVVLRHGPHSIEGALRFLPDGRRIILYLRDEPMHQMTYQRKQAADSNDPSAPDDDHPNFFGV
jgi:DNA-directed RNA polymerase subunit RPC12/RpoP